MLSQSEEIFLKRNLVCVGKPTAQMPWPKLEVAIVQSHTRAYSESFPIAKKFPDSQATWIWIPILIIFEDGLKQSPKIIIGEFLQGVWLYSLFTVWNCQLRGSDNILSLVRGHRDQCLWDEKVSVTQYIWYNIYLVYSERGSRYKIKRRTVSE